jgi:hypothetical protein
MRTDYQTTPYPTLLDGELRFCTNTYCQKSDTSPTSLKISCTCSSDLPWYSTPGNGLAQDIVGAGVQEKGVVVVQGLVSGSSLLMS